MDSFLHWWILLPNLIYWFMMPLAAFVFLCRYCEAAVKWPLGVVYTAVHALLLLLEIRMEVTGASGLLLELLLLTAAGGVLLGGRWAQAAAAAVLVNSVLNVCGGIAQLLFFWALSAAGPLFFSDVFRYSDLAREAVRLLLAVCFLSLLCKYFRQDLMQLTWSSALPLAVPVFYISLVERTIRDTIYGDTVIADTELGLTYPLVDHIEILILQVFACVCLFLTLSAYQQTIKALLAQQTLRILRQQGQAQEAYIREAQSRYEQTRSFRHDVKNHLTVLAELLRADRTEEACAYLSHLAEIAGGLSYPVQTGCAAVDALLGSKLAAARRKEIAVTCDIQIPHGDKASEIDWCIVLSNAVDNAVQASEEIPAGRRFIRISGKMQGNLYLLSVENGCKEALTGVPEEGIGLANIRAAAAKHNGTVRLEAGGGVFKLDMLFVLSHPSDGPSQQTS